MQIKDDHIHFEINGGPVHRKKWYEHLEVSGANGMPVSPAKGEPQSNPHGSFVDVYFGKYVPEMTVPQLRALLFPVLDFDARNKEQAYLNTVPPKVKEAIQAHRVLVGMNQEMVLHAKGKPPRKVRERDGETEYEEWIYGEPPADVDFVRLVGDEVVRVETMKVSGEKIVRTEKEIILQQPDKEKEKDKEAKSEPGERPANAPSLKRPGKIHKMRHSRRAELRRSHCLRHGGPTNRLRRGFRIRTGPGSSWPFASGCGRAAESRGRGKILLRVLNPRSRKVR